MLITLTVVFHWHLVEVNVYVELGSFPWLAKRPIY